MTKKSRAMVLLGVSVALAMVLSYLEFLLPTFVPVPGIKPGLANLVIVFLLYRLGAGHALGVSVVRVCLSSLLFGTIVSFWYSIAGALVSFLLMFLLYKLPVFSVTGVSVAGAVAHNLAQITVAVFLLATPEILFYAPILLVSGTISGVIIGIGGSVLIRRIGKGGRHG